MAKKKKMSKEERERYDALVMQMKQYEKQGIGLSLSGREMSAEENAGACAVREHGMYMGDYIWTADGRLSEIRYDKIEEEPETRTKTPQ